MTSMQSRNQILVRCLLFIAALIIGANSMEAQEVSVPTWCKRKTQGGLLGGSSFFTCPEYSGQNPLAVRAQLKMIRGTGGVHSAFTYSPSSGILSYHDLTTTPHRHVGWKTNFDRAYFMILIPRASGETFDHYVLVAWNDTSNKSVLLELKVLNTGVIQQSNYGLESAVNAIWGHISSIDGKMYIYDLQTNILSRYLDTNSDGKVDTIDGGFSVHMPM